MIWKANAHRLVSRFPVRDVLGIGGLVAFVYGLWLAWEPLAWIVGGPLLVAVSLAWGVLTQVGERRRR